MYSYFVILIYMADVPLRDIELYWSSEKGIHLYVFERMTCNRFEDLTRAFSIVDPGATGHPEFGKVSKSFF